MNSDPSGVVKFVFVSWLYLFLGQRELFFCFVLMPSYSRTQKLLVGCLYLRSEGNVKIELRKSLENL